MHLGVDSCHVHIASGLGKKVVALYGNSRAANVGPYWTSESDKIIFEPDYSNCSPCYSNEESPKRINEIKPEDIAKAVCKLLNIDFKFKFKTINIGSDYIGNIIEVVPNAVVKASSINNISVRMDYHFDENVLQKLLEVNGKMVIVTDKPISIDIFKKYKDKIIGLYYEVKDSSAIDFVNEVFLIGIPVELISYESKKTINELKMDYMDYGNIRKINIPKLEDVGIDTSKNYKNIYYKSNKIVLSNNKKYHSRQDQLDGDEVTATKVLKPIKNTKEFRKDLQCFYIFEKV